MNHTTKEVSCYSSSLLIDYASEKGVTPSQLFDGIEEYGEILKNPLEWTEMQVWEKLGRNYEKALGNKPNVLETAGQEITESQITNFQLLFFKVAPISLIIDNVSKHMEKNINNILKVSAVLKKNGEVNVYFEPTDISKYSTQICDFNRGCTYATLKLKGYKNLSLKEITCAARHGDVRCHYKLTWTPNPGLIQQMKDFFLFRFRNQQAIINHMERNHQNLQEQYREILSLKDFYSHIMDNMTEGVLWLDEEGKITFANNSFAAISKYRQNELVGRYFWELLSGDLPDSEYQQIIIHNSRKKPVKPETREFLIITKTGEKRIGQTSFMWVASEHREPGFLISIRDITDQKKVEKKLFALENRYRSLYENSPALIIGLDSEGNFLYANPAMEEQCGYSEKELKTMHFSQLVAPDADFDVQHLFTGRFDQGENKLSEVHYKSKSGEWKTIALSTYLMYDDSGNTTIAGIGVDITETMQLNEQLMQTQRMNLLGKMAGGLAHDFNNLLSVIMGFSEFIHRNSSEETIKKYAGNIQKASTRAAGLTRNLLTFSRGEIVKRSQFNLNDLIEEVQNLIVPITPANTRIHAEIPEKIFYIKGDSGKMHQCILNLCMNARDAIGKKLGSITLRLLDSKREDFVSIEVEDTGPGILPDVIEHIYDPFFSTKRKRKGTGLGLSVVYGIVKTHGGEITLNSRPGEGTTFTIELPVYHHDRREEKDQKRELYKDIIDKSSKIMIVDDDELLGAFCREALQERGYSTVLFSSSEKALHWFKENNHEIQVTLADIIMPNMDGTEMIKQFRGIKKDLNVIWMSAYLSPDKKRPHESDPVLKKPFTPEDLIEKVDSFFN